MESVSRMKSYVMIWVGLICIAGIEVFLTYRDFSNRELLATLLILAFIEAGIALMYFMHLKYEKPGLFWSLIPAVIFVLLMMNQIWPDAYRLARLRLQ
jgi:heme/copper-type cytochrome/quinol oxidase subunit 4